MDIDVKLDFNELFDKAFTALAEAMNIAEEKLLPILVKQMFIEGVTGLIICATIFLVWLIAMFFGLYSEFKNSKRTDSYIDAGKGWFIFFLAFCIGGMIVTVIFFAEDYFMDSITKTFNPEYAVIEEVVNMASDLLNGKGE